jgi:hypothetical protein
MSFCKYFVTIFTLSPLPFIEGGPGSPMAIVGETLREGWVTTEAGENPDLRRKFLVLNKERMEVVPGKPDRPSRSRH